MVENYGSFEMTGGEIANGSGRYGVENFGELRMGGNPRFNMRSGLDVLLAIPSNPIQIIKPFVEGATIRIAVQGGTGTVTSGFSEQCGTSIDPSTIFKAVNITGIGVIGVRHDLVDGEVVIETYDTYVDEHGNQQNCFDINPLRVASDNSCNLEPGWYMLGGDLDLKSMTVSGDVNLVVRDDASIRVYNGIELTRGNSLTIWGEKENTGKLQVYGYRYLDSSARQAIGVQDRLQPKLRGVQGKRQDPSSSDGEIRPEEEEQGGQLLRVHVPARAHTDGVFASGPHVWERHDDGRVSHAEAGNDAVRLC